MNTVNPESGPQLFKGHSANLALVVAASAVSPQNHAWKATELLQSPVELSISCHPHWQLNQGCLISQWVKIKPLVLYVAVCLSLGQERQAYQLLLNLRPRKSLFSTICLIQYAQPIRICLSFVVRSPLSFYLESTCPFCSALTLTLCSASLWTQKHLPPVLLSHWHHLLHLQLAFLGASRPVYAERNVLTLTS